MTLWLVRHARPLVAAGLCYGSTDVPAEPAHTERTAAELAAVLPGRLAIYSSPLQRCVQLAQALQSRRPELAWKCDPRLAEMDFGAWEGHAWEAIDRGQLDAWTAGFADHRCGGGESVSELLLRVGEALADARLQGRDVLWVTHAGVARALRLVLSGARRPRADQWPLEGPAFGELLRIPLAAADGHDVRENQQG